MVIYIIHIVVAKTISYFFYNISNQNKLVLYFGSTFLLAVVLYYLVERKIKKLSDIFMKHILKIDSKSSVGAWFKESHPNTWPRDQNIGITNIKYNSLFQYLF